MIAITVKVVAKSGGELQIDEEVKPKSNPEERVSSVSLLLFFFF